MFKKTIFKIKELFPFRILNLEFRIFSESGQTLIEAIVALSALLISLAGISIAVIYAVNNTTFIKNQNLASKYAQQGMEYLKNKTDNGETVTLNPAVQGKQTDDFRNLSGPFCFAENYDISTSIAGCQTNIQGFFERSVTFEKDTCGGKPFSGSEATVTVKWTSSKCPNDDALRYCHKAEFHSCFSKEAVSDL